jgi:hypothetical protein
MTNTQHTNENLTVHFQDINNNMSHPAPHYINQHQSDMRGIKGGWYAKADLACAAVFVFRRNAGLLALI